MEVAVASVSVVRRPATASTTRPRRSAQAAATTTPGRIAVEPGLDRLRTVRRMAPNSGSAPLQVKSAADLAKRLVLERTLKVRSATRPP